MASLPIEHKLLTLEEFDELYGDEKPYYEYWDGQALQKAMPTRLHGLLTGVLLFLLREIELPAAPEVRLALSKTRQPLPDIIAGFSAEDPYPTKPGLIAIEILSPGDRMSRILDKLRFYAEQRISYIYVFDPEAREAWRFNGGMGSLETIDAIDVHGYASLGVDRIWATLDQDLAKWPV